MTEFRALPVDEAVALIRTWAEADWPLTREKTYAIRDRLGWNPTPGHENFFTTNFGFGHEDAGAYFPEGSNELADVDFLLARFGLPNILVEDPAAVDAALETYRVALTGLWGDPVVENYVDGKACEWSLPSGAEVRVASTPRLVKVVVRSPKEAAQWARDVEFEEMYGFEDEDE